MKSLKDLYWCDRCGKAINQNEDKNHFHAEQCGCCKKYRQIDLDWGYWRKMGTSVTYLHLDVLTQTRGLPWYENKQPRCSVLRDKVFNSVFQNVNM
jgi:hypothetical protein